MTFLAMVSCPLSRRKREQEASPEHAQFGVEDRETGHEAPRPVLPLRWNSASRSETAPGFGVHGGRQRPL